MLLDYLTLCFVAFVSATIFPLGSEALFLLNLEKHLNPFYLLLFASFGNISGSVVNYWLGFKGEEYLEEKKVITKQQVQKYKPYFDRYGGYSLLLSWVPLIGDPLTFIAGILKYDTKKFILIVSIAKFGRYLFIYLLWQYYS
ncbi:MAG: YqaA family protein [Campylobacterota bacterium]|nr:YqaA family protein [Campylobacterota bacterium]